NIDASALRLTPAPPVLLRRPGHRLAGFGLPATTGLLATAATDAPVYGAAGLALSLALALTGLGALLLRLLPGRRPAGEQEVLDWFEAWLTRYRPTVGLYFSGGASSAYQANMWLEPLARLDERPVIVLRERHMVQRIAATDIPVVCLPKVSTLMRLEHSTLRVLLHPSNSGKTSQVLRIPTIKHAFVNHGESDKLSSCNPYAKAYDEVWVAGPAARERYALAEVGVEDKDVVEIGRPQLDAVRPYAGPPAPGTFTTVLYAPTWRDDQSHSAGQYLFDLRIDLEDAQRRLGDDHVLLIRRHSNVVDAVPGAGNGFVWDASEYPDIVDLYIAADIMITDYSSVMFDYAHLKRPMLFFTYDLEHYRDTLRGFYFDFEQDSPGPLIDNSKELVDAIRDIDQVRAEYQERFDRFHHLFCDLDDGNASARVVDRMI
ncbi:CDP-glycerol glycerophosphotransferase family protein, partial [Streptomyces scabiei]|uniref:CDP-glycerol glycerophosphotransferase family protein n=1 Tax=Streptomyces scabiei TaxID=1930 RepID=UPI0039F12435